MMIEHRLLAEVVKRIHEDLTAKHRDLGSGSQIVGDDAAASGMRMARAVGTIAGLRAALTHIEQAEQDMSIKPKGELP